MFSIRKTFLLVFSFFFFMAACFWCFSTVVGHIVKDGNSYFLIRTHFSKGRELEHGPLFWNRTLPALFFFSFFFRSMCYRMPPSPTAICCTCRNFSWLSVLSRRSWVTGCVVTETDGTVFFVFFVRCVCLYLPLFVFVTWGNTRNGEKQQNVKKKREKQF